MNEEEVLKQSQAEIKVEGKKIADSVTRILMLGGPRFVKAILESMLHANEKIMTELKIATNIEFEEGQG